MRVGIIGAGTISGTYAETLLRSAAISLGAVADLDLRRARAVAAMVPDCQAMTVNELLASDDIELVVNLTPPRAHESVTSAALGAGMHVYSEKPLATTRAAALSLVRQAERAGRVLGCAPDSVLAPPVQTARRAIDMGLIGDCLAASAVMAIPGHERWHHDPDFYYQPGGGPLFDMGPYYLSALIQMLGPVDRVGAMTARASARRRILTGPRAGLAIPVTVDTHVSALLHHARGTVTTMVMSFDVVGSTLPKLEVYGSRGSISIPDPNRFEGEVRLLSEPAGSWTAVRPSAGVLGCSRGFGVTEMVSAIFAARAPRASARLALHVVDVMSTILEAAQSCRTLTVATDCPRPDPLGPHEEIW